MALRIYPDAWIFPAVSEFYLHVVVALLAAWASGFEDGVRAIAIAGNGFENKRRAHVMRPFRSGAGFTQVSRTNHIDA